MRRADTLLFVIVGALALFVGAKALEQRPRKNAACDAQVARCRPEMGEGSATVDARTAGVEAAARSLPSASTMAAASARSRAAADIVRGSSEGLTPVPNLDELRARVSAANDSYMADMLSADKEIVRWPDRRERGLRVWVQSTSAVRDWDLRYAQMARDAFAEWSDGLPARLDFVLDSASADIQIVWVERFPPEDGQQIGSTQRTNDRNGWLLAAEISIAVHDSSGETMPPSDLTGTVRHEAGHALGLGHSKDPHTKMFPVEMTHEITPADRATLRLLYELAPGSVR
jgi:predicted Zn-dependent protease